MTIDQLSNKGNDDGSAGNNEITIDWNSFLSNLWSSNKSRFKSGVYQK